MTLDLGFVEKCESWQVESRFFPSKVGGKPAWLNLRDIPGEKDFHCEYLFRSQLPRINEFYSPEPPIEQSNWRIDISTNKWIKTCYTCGILAPNHCSKCKIVNYCCRAHQIYDWKHGHKEICDGNQKIVRINKFLFPEYEIVIEREDKEDAHNSNDLIKEEEEIKKYETMVQKNEAGIFQNEDVQNELMNMANQQEDETFSKFLSTIKKYPDQILRYDRGGNILYISGSSKINEVPKCSECNGERQFEFQIMPQLLNFLDFENTLNCIDWGILAIFTCIKSCVPKNGYSLEYVWKQDIMESNPNEKYSRE
ncbi:programmed cell death protein 2 isoform X5 [Apis laboriosa]|uniref:programmed cell death protein 2 isoform X5 n=1 Tax=Apis laboriosa TaxID=183418 RepID=UPI001CC437EB|nr:programmed cell death protein 2 isoform X5 [Apis laboriosa]